MRIGDAARLIVLGRRRCDGGRRRRSRDLPVGIAGFAAARALSTGFNDTPERASRPWDKDRDGFVMGEGAGVVVLEELEHAKRRGAKIYAEVIGYGLSGDAYHITAPAEDGNGAFRAMRAALKRAGIDPEDIDYINAHGTSTPLGDEIELGAVKRLFGDAPTSSPCPRPNRRSAICWAPPAPSRRSSPSSPSATRSCRRPSTSTIPSAGCDIDLVPKQAKERKVRAALSNSFGFGGTNAILIFGGPP